MTSNVLLRMYKLSPNRQMLAQVQYLPIWGQEICDSQHVILAWRQERLLGHSILDCRRHLPHLQPCSGGLADISQTKTGRPDLPIMEQDRSFTIPHGSHSKCGVQRLKHWAVNYLCTSLVVSPLSEAVFPA